MRWWEYKRYREWRLLDEETLWAWGREGWELVSYHAINDPDPKSNPSGTYLLHTYYFKRPL